MQCAGHVDRRIIERIHSAADCEKFDMSADVVGDMQSYVVKRRPPAETGGGRCTSIQLLVVCCGRILCTTVDCSRCLVALLLETRVLEFVLYFRLKFRLRVR